MKHWSSIFFDWNKYFETFLVAYNVVEWNYLHNNAFVPNTNLYLSDFCGQWFAWYIDAVYTSMLNKCMDLGVYKNSIAFERFVVIPLQNTPYVYFVERTTTITHNACAGQTIECPNKYLIIDPC